MRIGIIVNEVFSGWTPNDIRLGGTEESVVQWSRQLSKTHEVMVFQNGFVGKDGLVTYLPRGEYPIYSFDVTLNIKSPDMPKVGRTLYFTNETDADKLNLSAYEGVIWPSQWAKDHIKVNNPNVYVVPHGYDSSKIYPAAKIPKTVLYASSPDRGLADLLEAWPQVVAAHPDAQLIVTYGATPRDIPNTLFLGNVSEDEMNELYRTSDVWCHPCSGGELFGITAVKAQAAGCVPVYYPTMALQETVQSGLKTSKAMLADDLIRTLGSETAKEAVREDLATKTFVDWEASTRELAIVLGLE
jgi:glycosyltransferase involved in cell wall biosynthesis